ncbi:MAG: hypothetical protein ABJP33_13185 [Pseudoruegeria sp.]
MRTFTTSIRAPQKSVAFMMSILIGLSACSNDQSSPLEGTPYAAVIDCVTEAGYVGTGGSLVTGRETVDEVIASESDNFGLTPKQQDSVRTCANAKLSL